MVKVDKVHCIRAEKRSAFDRHHVYVLSVTWSDKKVCEIGRAYTAFFDFRAELATECKDKKDVKLPELHSQRWFEKGLLAGITSDAAIEKKKSMIADFCKQILKLPKPVVTSSTVTKFFEQWDSDTAYNKDASKGKAPMKPEKEKKKPAMPSLIRQDTLDQPIPHQEQFLASMDFQAHHPGEVSLISGSTVDVLQKDLSGWWFVMVEDTQEEGWAPSTMLVPADPNRVSVSDDPGPGALGTFRAVNNWEGSGDEVSYKKGDLVEVLNASMDGWWTVSCWGKVGCTPATNLEPIEEKSESGITRNRLKGSLYHHQSIYKRRSPPPRRQSNESLSELYAKVVKKPKAAAVIDKGRRPLQYTEVAFDGSSGGPSKPVIVMPEEEAGGTTYAEIVIKPCLSLEQEAEPPKNRKVVPLPPLLKSQSVDVVLNDDDDALYENRDRSSSLSTGTIKSRKYSYENVGGHTNEKFFRVTHDYTPSPGNGSLPLRKGDIVMSVRGGDQAASQTYIFCALCSQSSVSKPAMGWVSKKVLFEANKDSIDQSRHPFPVISDVYQASINPPDKPRPERPKPQPSPRISKQNQNHREAPTTAPPRGPIDVPRTPSPRLPPRGDHPKLDLSPKSPDTLVEAVFNYDTCSPNCLSFHSGDSGLLRRRNADGWWCVEMDGREGWVPADYWKEVGSASGSASPKAASSKKDNPNRGPWFVGPMTREDCERLMFAKAKPKEFVIRESTNRVGDYSLSVLYESRVRHFPIELRGESKFYIGKHDFKNISKVVKYYQGKPIFYDDNKKPVCLGQPFTQH